MKWLKPRSHEKGGRESEGHVTEGENEHGFTYQGFPKGAGDVFLCAVNVLL